MTTIPIQLRPLLDETLALVCGLVDAAGDVVTIEAIAGQGGTIDLVGTAVRLWSLAPRDVRELLVSFEDRTLLIRPAPGGFCFVLFDHRSSLALVRLRLRALFGPRS